MGAAEADDQTQGLIDGPLVREGAGYVGFQKDEVGSAAVTFAALDATRQTSLVGFLRLPVYNS